MNRNVEGYSSETLSIQVFLAAVLPMYLLRCEVPPMPVGSFVEAYAVEHKTSLLYYWLHGLVVLLPLEPVVGCFVHPKGPPKQVLEGSCLPSPLTDSLSMAAESAQIC